MRILIIGAVAAGTSAATEIRRRDKSAEIVIYEKDRYISYAGCGMPYYLSGEFTDFSELVPRDPKFFMEKHNVHILTGHEALGISPDDNEITVKNLLSGEVFRDKYDYLIISTGASAEKPPLKEAGRPNVFLLRTVENTLAIKKYISENSPKTAAIIGTGLVGIEMCESFTKAGITTSLIARSSLAKSMDKDMTAHIEKHIAENGVRPFVGTPPAEITENGVIMQDGSLIEADMVLLATGVRPNVELARSAGIQIGPTGAIKVDDTMRTVVENIYACGDCAQQFHVVTGKPVYRPLGSTANKTGVIAGNRITGGDDRFRGILGTSIFRVFDMTVAQTGLSEKEALENGFDTVVSLDEKPGKPPYMGGRDMIVKTVAEKTTGRILGAQIVGYQGVDKRIDVLAATITLKGTAQDLICFDLAYAPPFSTPRDPLYYTGIKLKSKIN